MAWIYLAFFTFIALFYPVYVNDTLEVIDIKWERIREYFKQQ